MLAPERAAALKLSKSWGVPAGLAAAGKVPLAAAAGALPPKEVLAGFGVAAVGVAACACHEYDRYGVWSGQFDCQAATA